MATTPSPDPTQLMAMLGHEYRRVREDHDREQPRGASRRRIKHEMDRLSERFERLLHHWVPEPGLRKAWHTYFYHGAERPEEPRFSIPPLFRGRAQPDQPVEVREASDGGYDLFVDGKLAEHHEIPWHLEPELLGPVQIGEWTCQEEFAVPDEAIAALALFLERSGSGPPAQWARALYEDGLIDTDFGLTPRGGRCLGKEPRAEIRGGGERANYCVLLANTARARVLTLASDAPEEEATLAVLLEAADLTNPAERARDGERFSETRPGMRREYQDGPRHGVSDRRENHRRHSERQFIELAVEAAAQVWSQFRTCQIIVVASAHTLGLLRPALARKLSGSCPYDIREFPRDLTLFTPPAVHDALAKEGQLPLRGRRMTERPRRAPNPH